MFEMVRRSRPLQTSLRKPSCSNRVVVGRPAPNPMRPVTEQSWSAQVWGCGQPKHPIVTTTAVQHRMQCCDGFTRNRHTPWHSISL